MTEAEGTFWISVIIFGMFLIVFNKRISYLLLCAWDFLYDCWRKRL